MDSYDGSEIQESTAMLFHLSRHDAEVQCFAPDIEQMHVVNHLTGEEMDEKRNVLVESARIARGNVLALSDLKVDEFDAVVFPGGFGAAKNLSTFAVDGADMKVNGEVKRVVEEAHKEGKVVGMACIAPVIAAKVLGSQDVALTVGKQVEEGDEKWPYAGTAEACDTMGATHVSVDAVTNTVVDEVHSLVTVPAYMANATPYEVFESVGNLVDEVITLAGKLNT
eukprot:TRINITY_DN1817_c0_g1_i1.p1 TRINITY_DN1817_c0_g1~~TRINITY_DN1817_c0_g1_i1.p1  ORF type:complete len:224 (-),score=86.13 TRINITY_DN1817_c0_g1_i1:56-727(-)